MKIIGIEEFNEMVMKKIEELENIENPTIEQKLEKRNWLRHLALNDSNNPKVFCGLHDKEITNLGMCMFCGFGHMTECHHPYTCDSEYCNHYAHGGGE